MDEEASSRPISWRTWRAASRNGSDSMSPTVPPISVMMMSGAFRRLGANLPRIRRLISSVMCGMTCTVSPRYSPRRSLRDHGASRPGPVVTLAAWPS